MEYIDKYDELLKLLTEEVDRKYYNILLPYLLVFLKIEQTRLP